VHEISDPNTDLLAAIFSSRRSNQFGCGFG